MKAYSLTIWHINNTVPSQLLRALVNIRFLSGRESKSFQSETHFWYVMSRPFLALVPKWLSAWIPSLYCHYQQLKSIHKKPEENWRKTTCSTKKRKSIKNNLLNIISVKIISSLTAINASTFSINTILTKLEPALSSWTIRGSNSWRPCPG